MKKNIDEDIRRHEDFPCPWMDGITIVNKAVLPKASLNSPSLNLHQDSNAILQRHGRDNPKMQMEAPKAPSSQSHPAGKIPARDNRILEFKLYYRAIVTKRDM